MPSLAFTNTTGLRVLLALKKVLYEELAMVVDGLPMYTSPLLMMSPKRVSLGRKRAFGVLGLISSVLSPLR